MLYYLVVLDIKMSAPNGYETALRLRESNQKSLIIFLTNSMDYTISGYGIEFRYPSKPIKKGSFSALDAAVHEIMANRFVFSADGESHVLLMDEIYYSTLKEVLSQLPAGYYGSPHGSPHKSYVVNFSHIKTATAQKLHLTNGVTIPISRCRQREFTEQFYEYLGR